MGGKKAEKVTMRIRVGESELEVTGPRKFVEKKIEDFLGLQKHLSAPVSPKAALRKGAQASQTEPRKLSPAQFFRKVAPGTDVERILAAGYFLEVFENQESFTALEAREVVRSAKIPPPKNPNDSINKNIKKGLMMAAGDKEGKMAFVLTSDGEEEIAATLNP